jgi:hypothetical protein
MFALENESIGKYDLTADGEPLGEGTKVSEELNKFIQVKFPLSSGIVQSKEKVTIKFAAHAGCKVPKVFGIRTIKE